MRAEKARRRVCRGGSVERSGHSTRIPSSSAQSVLLRGVGTLAQEDYTVDQVVGLFAQTPWVIRRWEEKRAERVRTHAFTHKDGEYGVETSNYIPRTF